jgi:uroporphyrin-III C-methyltransferase/precorrin-2 dehydrogenase/sirohydrochlorin ferrochelatase
MAADIPVALIEEGTSRAQRVLTGKLADIVAKNSQAQMKSPTLIIVGRVVKLRDELAWR